MARIKNILNRMIRWIRSLRRPSGADNLRQLRKLGESPDQFIIREASLSDLPALAALHVETWNETYGGVKHKPSLQLRTKQWQEQFAAGTDNWFCYVVENPKGGLAGFAKGERYASEDLPGYSGQLSKIYLLCRYQRLGLGRRLLGYVARRFIKMGINDMVLFGIPQNPSCSFHEAMGGKKLIAKNGEFHGGYGWKDLHELMRRCPEE
jgi:ribosomal protein S18 acetylase RimI-like enzyme